METAVQQTQVAKPGVEVKSETQVPVTHNATN